VMTYTTKVQSFPANVFAGMFGFAAEPFFQVANEAEREAPQVKF